MRKDREFQGPGEGEGERERKEHEHAPPSLMLGLRRRKIDPKRSPVTNRRSSLERPRDVTASALE
jgi:hypothetical protein